MKTITFKVRNLEPGEAAITKTVEVPIRVLTKIARDAIKSLGGENVILLHVSCKVEVMTIAKGTL